MEETKPIVFFDGDCNLCNSAVQFIIKRDRKERYNFSTLQGETAKRELSNMSFSLDSRGTFVLKLGAEIYTRSTAALKVVKNLDGLWPILYVLIIVPRFLRDAVYSYVAKNRYRWFGKRDACWLPSPELRRRFLP